MPAKRIWVCPAAIQCCRQCKKIVIWDLLTDISRKEKWKKSKNQCWQPCQHVLGFMGCLSKPKSEKVANLGCSGWSWIKKELRYRSGGGGWPEQEEEEGQWEVTEGERSHQSRQHCWFSLFKVTALTDTTRPGGCLQDQMLLPLRGSKWQFCMALDKMHHTAGENLQG